MSREDLTDVQLADVQLVKANLSSTQLDGANLTGARLHRATLTRAFLSGADLTAAKNLLQQQLDSGGDDQTKLPAGLQRPVYWSVESTAPPAADR